MPLSLDQITSIIYPQLLGRVRLTYQLDSQPWINNLNFVRGQQFEVPLSFAVNPDIQEENTKVEFDE